MTQSRSRKASPRSRPLAGRPEAKPPPTESTGPAYPEDLSLWRSLADEVRMFASCERRECGRARRCRAAYRPSPVLPAGHAFPPCLAGHFEDLIVPLRCWQDIARRMQAALANYEAAREQASKAGTGRVRRAPAAPR